MKKLQLYWKFKTSVFRAENPKLLNISILIKIFSHRSMLCTLILVDDLYSH